LGAMLPSIDQATQPVPRGLVASWGGPPANVPPWMLNLVTTACLVSGRFAIATSEHSSETSAARPLASATRSWVLGAQLLRSPVSAGCTKLLPFQLKTSGW